MAFFGNRVSLMEKSRLSRVGIGTTIAEVPLGLWIVFIGIAFPAFMLATMTVRFALFWEATRMAAEAACQCQTYQNDSTGAGNLLPTSSTLSAVNQATTTAQQVAALFPGVTVGTVKTWIIQTPVSQPQGGQNVAQVYGPNTALGLPADTQQYMYQIRVTLIGQIQPIIPYAGGFMGSVPGATQPIAVQLSEDRVFENPGGLNS